MNIEVGKLYKTRAGYKVAIYSTTGRGAYPVHGIVVYPDHDSVVTWTNQGSMNIVTGNHAHDIVSEWVDSPLELWVNVYDSGFYGYPTKAQAYRMTNEGTLKCVHMKEVVE